MWPASCPGCHFNPRSREGSDRKEAKKLGRFYGISIHAPARGATLIFCLSLPCMCYFNPRSREGSDLFYFRLIFPIKHFNPRSRGGSDVPVLPVPVTRKISIHAPARGATNVPFRIQPSKINFNPRSREGSDRF